MAYKTYKQTMRSILKEKRKDPIGYAFGVALAYFRVAPYSSVAHKWQADAIGWASR